MPRTELQEYHTPRTAPPGFGLSRVAALRGRRGRGIPAGPHAARTSSSDTGGVVSRRYSHTWERAAAAPPNAQTTRQSRGGPGGGFGAPAAAAASVSGVGSPVSGAR